MCLTRTFPIHADELAKLRKYKNATPNRQLQRAAMAYVKYALSQAGAGPDTHAMGVRYVTEVVRYTELAQQIEHTSTTAEVSVADLNDISLMAAQELAAIAIAHGAPTPRLTDS